jgi:hypothetical protein
VPIAHLAYASHRDAALRGVLGGPALRAETLESTRQQETGVRRQHLPPRSRWRVAARELALHTACAMAARTHTMSISTRVSTAFSSRITSPARHSPLAAYSFVERCRQNCHQRVPAGRMRGLPSASSFSRSRSFLNSSSSEGSADSRARPANSSASSLRRRYLAHARLWAAASSCALENASSPVRSAAAPATAPATVLL